MAAVADLLNSATIGSPPGSPPPPPAVVPEPLQPILSILTQGLNVHATRLDALARAVTRLERGAVTQAEDTK